MVLDSSVLLHILCRKPGYTEAARRPDQAQQLLVGAPTREGETQLPVLEDLLRRLRVEILPDAEHCREALSAFRRYGKGRHPAALTAQTDLA